MRELMLIGGLLVLASAILAALGFRGKEQIVGIDLGTTFSVVALRSRDAAGAPTVTVLPDRISGKPLLPSVVSYLPNGSIVVGDQAVILRNQYPQNTIYNAKRFIGRKLDEVHGDVDTHPFAIVDNSNGSAVFKIPSENGNKPLVSPIDVGAEVVKHLKMSITKYIGYDISRAVICVPAKFTEKETKATQQAFEQAGVKVMRVLEEPTAAAVAYGLHKKPGTRHTLVYDIGGGTLDTSLLYMNGRSVSVLGVAGDDRLGGSDFDLKMQELLLRKFAEVPAQASPPADTTLHACDANGLHIAGEQAKIKLSIEMSVDVFCAAEDGAVLSVSVTRSEFEEACADLFARSMAPVEKVLADQMMAAEHVHDIVLVGGASRTPKLRALLQQFFGPHQKLHTEIDPDVTVAYGAANVVD